MRKYMLGAILLVFLLFPLTVSAVSYSDIICTPSETFCSDDGNLLQCGEFGDEEEFVENCDDKVCSFDTSINEFRCMDKSEIGGGNDNGFLVVLIILGIIAIFGTIVYSLIKNVDKEK